MNREKELQGIAEGLESRGMPPGLARQTVDLVYRMGFFDGSGVASEWVKRKRDNEDKVRQLIEDGCG